MSNERSSSAVRDLRSIFEIKQSESNLTDNQQQQQQNSSNRNTSREERRPLSKVRSSFVLVEGGPTMASTSENEVPTIDEAESVTQESTASLRRPSFHENAEEGEQLAALKTVISQENERREKDSSVAEAIPEAAIESGPGTPVVEFRKGMALAPETASRLANAGVSTESTANPDKPVTSRDEEEPGTLRPAEPTDAAAIEQTPIPDEPEHSIGQVPTATVPLTKTAAPAANAAKSAAKSAPAKDLNRKMSRSSLASPTAASVARVGVKRESLASGSAAVRPREITKPVGISSHLLAPTAASRARQEQDKPSGTIAPVGREATKPATVRPTRTSLARATRPASQTSDAIKRSTPSSSFLDRMTKPTAASQNRSQEKYESKSPRKSLPLHRKPASIGSGAKSAFPTSALVEEGQEPVADPSTPTKASISTP